ncbi:ADP-ribosylglycohydrolase family protein [Vibrio sp. RC27]
MSSSSSRNLQDRQRLDRSQGALVGLAVGDAVGTTLEFLPRGSFSPLTDMVGGGHFRLKKGYWTDDTSMALCLGYSLIKCESFDALDQMTRYCNWMDAGYMSSTGSCFDIGVTVSSALARFKQSGEPYSGSEMKMSSGNGSIMRLAPVPIFYQYDVESVIFYGGESSRTTHASPLCIDACCYLAELIAALISGGDKTSIYSGRFQPKTDEIAQFTSAKFLDKSYLDLVGSGYVVRSLEASLWCFYHGNSYEECVLAAANLGDDADTTAAITGQLAGAFYGYSGIKQEWREALYWHNEIVDLAASLFHYSRQEY